MVDTNTYKPGTPLPDATSSVGAPFEATKNYTAGFGKSDWPIRSFAELDVNVNAKYGGCAGLVLVSDSYGYRSRTYSSTCQLFLYRSGFDGNHFSYLSLGKCHKGHFHPLTNFVTNEEGDLIGDCSFGTNHIGFLSNDINHGNLGHGVLCKGPKEADTSYELPLNSPGVDCRAWAGSSILICSGWSEGEMVHATYLLHTNCIRDIAEAVLLKGKDSWKFQAYSKGCFSVSGPNCSCYAIYHNRDDNISSLEASKARHFTVSDGDEALTLLNLITPGCFLILCSSSSGVEDATVSSLYQVELSSSNKAPVSANFIEGLVGKLYRATTADLWKFSEQNGALTVIGPHGPCRYAFISNTVEDDTNHEKQSMQTGLPATEKPYTLQGAVKITEEAVIGWVTQPSELLIKLDEKLVCAYDPSQLIEERGKWAFHRNWTKDEEKTGLHLARVYTIRKGTKGNEDKHIELDGSPVHLVRQPPGVVYALNCAGPAFEANTGIVYGSEFSQFASFTYDWNSGSQCRAYGGAKYPTDTPQSLFNSLDGPLYSSLRTTWTEPRQEQKINYLVDHIENDNYILRLHWLQECKAIYCNGKDITQQIKKAENQVPALMNERRHCFCTDVPVQIRDNQLHVFIKEGTISGFALLQQSYKDPELTEDEKQAAGQMEQKLADQAEPLLRTMALKAREIIGWSPNLLKNASAEAELEHWQVRGDWTIYESGYGTEAAFQSSFMECIKFQVVDLTEHFPIEFLDASPDIQVSEWYREGIMGGGFYTFEAQLLSYDGEVIEQHNSGEIGTLYNKEQWQQKCFTFTGYGPGVRQVRLCSTGRDDKCWRGHYGTIISAAVIRVKRKNQSAANDAYEDIVKGSKSHTAVTEKLVGQLLTEHRQKVDSKGDDENVDATSSTTARKLKQVPAVRQRRNREIRLFVSSTFKDFKREREILIKDTFREIQQKCQDRGVHFTYVDLRWGITEDQSKDGKTIAICLQQIERCRPYFVCMLGERFGWSQTEDNPDKVLNSSFTFAVNNFSTTMGWIDRHRYDASVTQLEVLHAVLNDVANRKQRSFFYVRDPVDPARVLLSPNEYKDMTPESPRHKEMQYRLRERIQSNKELNSKTYKNPEEVCGLIKQDLQACLDKDFPQSTELTTLDREWEAQEAFAEARRRVYIGRAEYYKQIDDHVAQSHIKHLVILGESGSGKSALLANWVYRLQQREPDTFAFMHFIGSSAESASHLNLLRRLYEELKRYFGFELAVPSSDMNLERDLPMWLKMASVHGRCIIVLDALNQLDEGYGSEGNEHDLLWLPRELPDKIHLVLSTLPGRAMEAVNAAGWKTIKVESLSTEEKGEIVTKYFENMYGKTLSYEQREKIVNSPQSDNPLYLRVMLDEVRMFGSFEKLTEKIEDYLTTNNAGELFQMILGRLEVDLKGEQVDMNTSQRLVRKSTCAIWCSHRGMSETEILDFLQVPSAIWSPLYLSLVDNLVNRNGILNFFHDYLRQAVETKYMEDAETKKQGYLDLANFFALKPIGYRVVDELPFLLARAGELERLRATLSNIEVFKRMIQRESGKFELIKYWKMLGDFGEVEKAYTSALSELSAAQLDTDEMRNLQQALGEFFMDLGLYNAARSTFHKLLKQLGEKYRESNGTLIYEHRSHAFTFRCQHPQVLDLLQKLGAVCQKQKDLDQAAMHYREAIERQNRIRNPEQKIQLTEGLLGMATVLYLQNDAKAAKIHLIRARELATQVLGSRHHIVAAILNKLGQLTYKQNRLEEALTYFIQDLRLTRGQVGTIHPRTAGILNDIALVYDDNNDPMASQLYEAALRIFLDVYGNNHVDVAVTRYNLGSFYLATNYFARAKFQFEQSLEIFEKFLGKNHTDTKEAHSALQEVSGIV